MTDREALEALVETWQEQRQDVLDMEKATRQGDLHAKGVACGIDYCMGELEEVLEE
jgi:hypothetical protein